MKERETETRMAAPNSAASNEGKGKAADHVLPIVNKSVSGPVVWKQVGKICKQGAGLKIAFADTGGASHIVFVTRQALRGIVDNRIPGDVVTITETASEIITTISGRAFRSRTGRALCIRTPYYAGSDMMIPWKMFEKVHSGVIEAAPVSIIQITDQGHNPSQNAIATPAHNDISAGLERCF